MKINTPMTEAEWAAADAEFKRVAESQKHSIRAAADKIERGEELTAFEKPFIAALLRGAADGIPTKRPGKRYPKKIPDDFPAIFSARVQSGKISKTAALDHYAEKYGVSTEALEKLLPKKPK